MKIDQNSLSPKNQLSVNPGISDTGLSDEVFSTSSDGEMPNRPKLSRGLALVLFAALLFAVSSCSMFSSDAPAEPSKVKVEIQVDAQKIIVSSPGKQDSFPIAHFGRSIIGCDGTVQCIPKCKLKLPQAGTYPDGRAVSSYRTIVSGIKLGNVLTFGNEFIVRGDVRVSAETCGKFTLAVPDFEKFYTAIDGEKGIEVTVR